MNKKNVYNVAFFDAEFTSKAVGQNKGDQELIQFAIFIYQVTKINGEIYLNEAPLYIYQTFVKPSLRPCLSKYIKELTKINQNNVDQGCDLSIAIETLYNIINQFCINDIYVWGPDRLVLKTNCILTKIDNDKSRIVCSKIKDISKKVSKTLKHKKTLSQHDACNLLKIKEIGDVHNAYYDALNLFQIAKTLENILFK